MKAKIVITGDERLVSELRWLIKAWIESSTITLPNAKVKLVKNGILEAESNVEEEENCR